MRFEVFHTGLLGRPNIIAVDMIQYPGLWGICFSHHAPNNNHPRYAADTTTEGVLRFLEAARDGRDGTNLGMLADYTVTTHHVDADSVLPVWALLHPEAALARRPLLERVARSGDFFLYLDETSARINAVIEGLHLRLRGEGRAGERLVDSRLSRACFDWLLPRLESLLDDAEPFSDLWEAPLEVLEADRIYLEEPGRVTEHWDQHLSLVETDHDPDSHAMNTVCRNDLLLVWRTDGPQRRLEVRPAIAWYELTSLPHRPRYDLAALAERLNRAERAPDSAPVWNYRPGPVHLDTEESRLSRQDLLANVSQWLAAHSEEQFPAAYRADIREVSRCREQHAIVDSHKRFAHAFEVSFQPGACFGGLHLLESGRTCLEGERVHITGGKHPVSFAVADDFYWNSAAAKDLQLEVVYEDVSEGTLRVQYDGWDDPWSQSCHIVLNGDEQTKTATFTLCDPRLGAGQENGADLCLLASPGTRLALKALTLRKEKSLS